MVLSRESKRGCLSHDGGWARGRLGQKFSLVGKLDNSGEMRSHMKAHVKYFTDLREVTMVRTFPVGLITTKFMDLLRLMDAFTLFIRRGRISFKRLNETLKLLKPHVEIKSIWLTPIH